MLLRLGAAVGISSIVMNAKTEKQFAIIFGVVLIITLLILAVIFPRPTAFQYFVFRIVLALASACTAVMLPGVLSVKVKTWIRATGALAVFVVVYFWNPANLLVRQVEPKQALESTIYKISDVSGGNNQFGSGNTQVINPAVTNVHQLQEAITAEKRMIRTLHASVKMGVSLEWTKPPKSFENGFPTAMWRNVLVVSCSTNPSCKPLEFVPQKVFGNVEADRRLIVEYLSEVSPGNFPLGASSKDLQDYDLFDFVVPIVNYENFAKDGEATIQSAEITFFINGARAFYSSNSTSIKLNLNQPIRGSIRLGPRRIFSTGFKAE